MAHDTSDRNQILEGNPSVADKLEQDLIPLYNLEAFNLDDFDFDPTTDLINYNILHVGDSTPVLDIAVDPPVVDPSTTAIAVACGRICTGNANGEGLLELAHVKNLALPNAILPILTESSKVYIILSYVEGRCSGL